MIEDMTVTKIGRVIGLPVEMIEEVSPMISLLDQILYGSRRPLTPQQKGRRLAAEVRARRQYVAADADWQAVRADADPVTIAVTDLHKPYLDGFYVYCEGCPADSDYGERAWDECQTFPAVKRGKGIE